MRFLGLSLLALGGFGCSKTPVPKAQPASAPAATAPERADLVAEALARFAPPPREAQAAAAASDVPLEQVEGLLQTSASSDRRYAKLAQQELAGLGEAALVHLEHFAQSQEVPHELRLQACAALGPLGPVAAPILMKVVLADPEVTVRRQAIYQLGTLPIEAYLPRLGLRLKYELDPENRLWLAWVLAEHGQGSALPVLFDLTRSEDQALVTRAQNILADLEAKHGMGSADLYAAWLEGSQEVWPQLQPTNALLHEVWLQIDQLSGAHFQLRGVDDARYALAQLGTWAVPLIASAMEDRDPYVRLHAAQVLERMGQRAQSAEAALIQQLADPKIGPTAAAALGALRCPTAAKALVALLGPEQPIAQRSAALRGLAAAGFPEHAKEAVAIMNDVSNDLELRLDAARVSLALQPNQAALDLLVTRLNTREGGMIAGPLTQWVAEAVTGPSAPELRASWNDQLATRAPIQSPQADERWRQSLQSWVSQHAAELIEVAQQRSSELPTGPR